MALEFCFRLSSPALRESYFTKYTMFFATNASREINRFLASQLLVIYSKIYASLVLARRESRLSSRESRLSRRVSRLARRETRGGNLLLSGTVYQVHLQLHGISHPVVQDLVAFLTFVFMAKN